MKFFILRKNYLMKRYFKILFIICVFFAPFITNAQINKENFSGNEKKVIWRTGSFPFGKKRISEFQQKEKLDSLVNNADFIVEGSAHKEILTFADRNGKIWHISQLEIYKKIKGDIPEDKIYFLWQDHTLYFDSDDVNHDYYKNLHYTQIPSHTYFNDGIFFLSKSNKPVEQIKKDTTLSKNSIYSYYDKTFSATEKESMIYEPIDLYQWGISYNEVEYYYGPYQMKFDNNKWQLYDFFKEQYNLNIPNYTKNIEKQARIDSLIKSSDYIIEGHTTYKTHIFYYNGCVYQVLKLEITHIFKGIDLPQSQPIYLIRKMFNVSYVPNEKNKDIFQYIENYIFPEDYIIFEAGVYLLRKNTIPVDSILFDTSKINQASAFYPETNPTEIFDPFNSFFVQPMNENVWGFGFNYNKNYTYVGPENLCFKYYYQIFKYLYEHNDDYKLRFPQDALKSFKRDSLIESRKDLDTTNLKDKEEKFQKWLLHIRPTPDSKFKLKSDNEAVECYFFADFQHIEYKNSF